MGASIEKEKCFCHLNGYEVKDAKARTEISEMTNYATPEMFGAVGDGATDDTQAIQNAINSLSIAGGGVVRLSNKSYAVKNIKLKTRVSLIGTGGGSELRGIDSSDVVTIPTESNVNEIASLTINGNNVAGVGLKIEASTTINGNQFLDRLTPDDETTEKNHCYGFVHDVNIIKCTAEGVVVGQNRVLMSFNNVNSLGNGKGFSILCHECLFNNINVNAKMTGLIVGGSNNKISNVKVYMSCTEAEPTPEGYVYMICGVLVAGLRNQLTNIESQDNKGNGFTVRGKSNVLTNVISDSCGRSSYTNKNRTDFHGFNIGGENNVVYGVNTVRAGNDFNIISDKGVKLEGAVNCKLDIKIEEGSAIEVPSPINKYESNSFDNSFVYKGALNGTLDVASLKTGVYNTGGGIATITSGSDSATIPQYATLYILRDGSVSGAFYFEAMTGNLNFFKTLTEVKTFNPTT